MFLRGKVTISPLNQFLSAPLRVFYPARCVIRYTKLAKRVQTIVDSTIAEKIDAGWAIRIAVSSSTRNIVMGVIRAIYPAALIYGSPRLETFSFILGMRLEQNPYSGEPVAMAYALSSPLKLRFRSIVLLISNRVIMLILR